MNEKEKELGLNLADKVMKEFPQGIYAFDEKTLKFGIEDQRDKIVRFALEEICTAVGERDANIGQNIENILYSSSLTNEQKTDKIDKLADSLQALKGKEA